MNNNIIMTAVQAAQPVITEEVFLQFMEEVKAKKPYKIFGPGEHDRRQLTLQECLYMGAVQDVILEHESDNVPAIPGARPYKAAAIMLGKGMNKPWLITKGEWSEYYGPIGELRAKEEMEKDPFKKQAITEQRLRLECLKVAKFKRAVEIYGSDFDIVDLSNDKAVYLATMKWPANKFLAFTNKWREDHPDEDRFDMMPEIISEDDLKLSALANAVQSKEAEDAKKDYEFRTEIEEGFILLRKILSSLVYNNQPIFGGYIPMDCSNNGAVIGEFLKMGFTGEVKAQVPDWANKDENGQPGKKDLTDWWLMTKTESLIPLLGETIWKTALGVDSNRADSFLYFREKKINEDKEKAEFAEKQQELQKKYTAMQNIFVNEDDDMPF